MARKPDFGGWATRNDILCSDGRIIRRDAFKHNDGAKVPLVWGHQHNDPELVLGHAILENRDEGVYAYGYFNDTKRGQLSKMLVESGDIDKLSIYANKLKHQLNGVVHGDIKEVSLVLAGANPGAYIESVMRHGEELNEEAYIHSGEYIELYHSEEEIEEIDDPEEVEEKVEEPAEEIQHADNGEQKGDTKMADKTVKEVFDELTEEQKNVVYAMIGQALEDAGYEDEEGDDDVKHNVFDTDREDMGDVLSHDEMRTIFDDAKRYGSLKDSVLAHGIDKIDYLFPEDRVLNKPPEFVSREMGWVQKVMRGVHHTPFSRIKSMFADITADDARAKGYIKGKMKKEEVFTLLKRSTTPTTVYKKQKLDRDDVIDITDFDVVSWIKGEMRMMLDEELARAYLFGDGRLASSDDKINEQNIRPILKDDDFFTIKTTVTVAADATDDEKAKAFIRAAVKSRKEYKGSGSPTLFTTEDVLTDCLLMEDQMGRVIYDSVEKLKNVLRVSDIVTVPVMEGLEGPNGGQLLGLIVNLNDYNVGADKGGAINMFDDFDIDYNAQKYLIETRCSGALIKPYSAIALELVTA